MRWASFAIGKAQAGCRQNELVGVHSLRILGLISIQYNILILLYIFDFSVAQFDGKICTLPGPGRLGIFQSLLTNWSRNRDVAGPAAFLGKPLDLKRNGA
ncbi:MAG: hypothetical protein FJY56_05580 [Betaproteobacteria bacterium]|nr:hypothetical protein [Betaproteobacteria bacterium]